ncbi:flippase-like domain-containing protein [Ectobacillus funiculus]
MRIFFRIVGVACLFLFVGLSFHVLDLQSLFMQMRSLLHRPILLALLVGLYGASFLLKTYAWRLYLHEKITLREGLYGLLYSLLVNHLSPLKIGDAVRIAAVTKRGRVSWAEAAQSVIVMRLLDLLILGLFGAFGTLLLFQQLSVRVLLFVLGSVLMLIIALFLRHKAPSFLQKQLQQLSSALQGGRGAAIVLLVAVSWIFEAFVIFGISSNVSFWEAVWVNSVTIAGQVFQLTPGGVGTYETVMTFALRAVGVPVQKAYEWALLSHGFKFLFSYGAGLLVFLIYPIQLASYLRYKKKGETNEWRK